ncbi:MAG: TIGR00153 family protein [Vicinamibacterales bacterium]|jgi:hypothetical protein|nr:TIGR00153 family protein [Acidobacteriota bacterium]MDP7339776.1 TIGR00153 family protein [Vicinamibacterales bacterium]MDP7671639.1 TIGR00153 family protein [Vicinamibacterales bacterium]HJO37029.1 TIGR00153 family protein [Vicinamibacterales bacterium]|tara:strand:+ start:3106 stop:3783 length:678 start_codon:yes stop_codon:yes gene_type:complete
MTNALGKLFGWSPFRLLQQHMAQVTICIAKMCEALKAFERGDWAAVESSAEEISRLEHEADKIKDEIRGNLTRRLFLPVERGRVLEILALQDSLADRAEDVVVLLTFKRLKILPGIADQFREFRDLNIKAVNLVSEIINQLDELVEAGFGGTAADKIREMVHNVAYAEHEVDLIQRKLLRDLFGHETELSPGDLYLWLQLIHELASLSNGSENLANRTMVVLEAK